MTTEKTKEVPASAGGCSLESLVGQLRDALMANQVRSNPQRDAALASVDVQRLVRPCPACERPIKHTDEIWFNGDGPPPSDAVQCGDCGCRGPISNGKHRGDFLGSIMDAITQWNAMPRKGDKDYRPALGPEEREATPPACARWLVELARRCAKGHNDQAHAAAP